jgi:hypothetical protein
MKKVRPRTLIVSTVLTFLVTVVVLNWGPGEERWNSPSSTARQVEVFFQDRARSRRITLEEWLNRPWKEQLMERAANLLGAQL